LNELAAVNFDSRLKGLWSRYKEAKKLKRTDFTACGYFHPIFPLIPKEDQEKQIELHLKNYEDTFGGRPNGLWPPELAFSMKIVPTLEKMGIKWVIVDEPHVMNGNKDKKRHELLYHPHYVEYEGYRIVVIPRDRGISNA